MSTVDGQGREARRKPSVPSFPKLLVLVGASLHATLIVDSQGRIVRVDNTLAPAGGWELEAPLEGRTLEEVLHHHPWLTHALRTALTGQETACEGGEPARRMRALVLPIFGDDGQCLGACARLRASAPQPETAHHEALKQELTRTQQQYEELLNALDCIVWEADVGFRFTFVNKQSERLLGYSPLEWIQEPDFWENHVHPEDRGWAQAYCMKATRERRPYEFEYRMVATDGRIVWLRAHVTVLVEEGQPPKLRGIMVDVTEQRQAREKLERTASLLRATFDSIADGVIVVDTNQRLTAYNKRFQLLWGLPDDVLLVNMDIAKSITVAAPLLKDPERFILRLQEMFVVSEQVYVDTIEFLDGRILELTSLPQRMGSTIIGRIWSYRDVTEERRGKAEQERLFAAEQNAREQLEESFALLDTFLNNAPIGLGFLSRDLRFIRTNDALAALHGKTREEEVGRELREMAPYVANTIEPLMRQVMETGEPLIGLDTALEVPATPGQLRYWRVSYYPVRTKSGRIVGVGAVVVELTQERRAQEERERLLREAHEAIRIRDDFLSIASHELKTPLTPIKLHLQRLEQRSAAGQPIPPQLAQKALAQVDRLTGVISDMLDSSRIEAGLLELEREPLSLQELIREVLAGFRPHCLHHPLEYEECAEALVVQGDWSRLAQVLTNLLENALKYSPQKGPIRVTLTRSGAEALVSVSDSGIGIPADQQAHLFERFFRARNAPVSGFGGLGLGLYISRHLVERHGGRIWVESESGQGATFRFTLPVPP
ncbi:PAS domain-containing sensor histidine kinase [Archangium lipolyticum]|uniref:PAS domain-containing sensor histidine kinase n=1 Tax=Archangium lipolyticum TaxID=2970465 RepID=UPI002149C3A1|nr:PAS domain-containing protein [Archangium lipolyticum]